LWAEFAVVPSEIEERLDGGAFEESVAALALAKALAVAAREADAIVLGADTVVVIDGVALGKPLDPEDARAMLRRLRGREHQVITGVAVVDARTGRGESRTVVTRVVMADVDDEVIDAYVATGEPLDKAGSYAVQGLGALFVEEVFGNYTNVVGLPIPLAYRLFRELGYDLRDFRGPTPRT
jgi:septum formation protein